MTRTPTRPKVALAVLIGRRWYKLERLSPDPRVAEPAWRLTRPDPRLGHVSYDLYTNGHGNHCGCPDFTFRREGVDYAGCKHLRALVELGLMPPQPRRQ